MGGVHPFFFWVWSVGAVGVAASLGSIVVGGGSGARFLEVQLRWVLQVPMSALCVVVASLFAGSSSSSSISVDIGAGA